MNKLKRKIASQLCRGVRKSLVGLTVLKNYAVIHFSFYSLFQEREFLSQTFSWEVQQSAVRSGY